MKVCPGCQIVTFQTRGRRRVQNQFQRGSVHPDVENQEDETDQDLVQRFHNQ
jgi:hypothetical protein